MIYHTESKLQGWRAIAVADSATEHLLFVGRSASHVRTSYVSAYFDVLDQEERAAIHEIFLERWNGAADEGHWERQTTLTVPTVRLHRPTAAMA
jgi:hypothetical protein